MLGIRKFVNVLSALVLLALLAATPVQAFDGRGGKQVVIAADQTIADDLYVTANVFVLDGTVTGDLLVAAQTVTINGTVEGDLIAAAQTVILNGKVSDDARIAGAGLQLGETASIGGDLVAAGASLEAKEGSDVQQELVVAAGQALLAGEVGGDVLAGTGGLELRGAFGGDVQAFVGESDQGAPPMSTYMMNSPIALPDVEPGLTISRDARVAGELKYTSGTEFAIPTDVVSGEVIRVQPEGRAKEAPPTVTQKAIDWGLDLLRAVVTLILVGLLLVWITPRFMQALVEQVRARPAGSLGWGVIAYAAFFFVLLVLVVATIIGGLVFGLLTLKGISGGIVWTGVLSMFALSVGFGLVTAFLTKVVVGATLGKWIFARANSPLSEHKFWPLILGGVIVAVLVSLPFIGWLFGLLVLLTGLGALWLWGSERVRAQPA